MVGELYVMLGIHCPKDKSSGNFYWPTIRLLWCCVLGREFFFISLWLYFLFRRFTSGHQGFSCTVRTSWTAWRKNDNRLSDNCGVPPPSHALTHSVLDLIRIHLSPLCRYCFLAARSCVGSPMSWSLLELAIVGHARLGYKCRLADFRTSYIPWVYRNGIIPAVRNS